MKSALTAARQFRTEFDRALTCYRTGDYGEAYRIADQLLVSFPLSVDLLLLRARVIQLLEEADLTVYPSATLDLTQESLETATTLAPRNAEAHNELGYFVLNVRDRASDALKHFESAERMASTELLQALVGQLKCLEELGDTEAVERIKSKLKTTFPDEILPGLIEVEW